MNRPLLAIAVIVALAAVGLSVYVASHPFIPEDALVERDIQATDWGPLAVTFRFFGWIGDAKGLVVEILIFFAILIAVAWLTFLVSIRLVSDGVLGGVRNPAARRSPAAG